MTAIWADPEVWAALRPGTSFDPEFVQDRFDHHLRHWDEHGFGLLAVVERASNDIVGWLGPWHPVFAPELAGEVELGWSIRASSWGRGLAGEGAAAVLDATFAHVPVTEVISLIHPSNERSAAVARRLGMRHLHDTRHPGLDIPLRVYAVRRGERAARAAVPR